MLHGCLEYLASPLFHVMRLLMSVLCSQNFKIEEQAAEGMRIRLVNLPDNEVPSSATVLREDAAVEVVHPSSEHTTDRVSHHRTPVHENSYQSRRDSRKGESGHRFRGHGRGHDEREGGYRLFQRYGGRQQENGTNRYRSRRHSRDRERDQDPRGRNRSQNRDQRTLQQEVSGRDRGRGQGRERGQEHTNRDHPQEGRQEDSLRVGDSDQDQEGSDSGSLEGPHHRRDRNEGNFGSSCSEGDD